MTGTDLVLLTLTVEEWRDLLGVMDDDAMSFGKVWEIKMSLERQLDEKVAVANEVRNSPEHQTREE